MSAAAQPRLSVEEYLALDREAEVKSEYFDGVLYPICGVSMAHSRLSARLGWRFEERLAGSPCVTFLSPLRVRVSRTKFVYPDLFVIGGKPDLTDEHADTLTNPAGCGSFAFEAKARSVNWIAGVRRVHYVRMKGDISARMGYVDRRT